MATEVINVSQSEGKPTYEALDAEERVAVERWGTKSKGLAGTPKKCIRIKANGERCKSWAVKGASVCNKHGGMAPKVKAYGKKRRGRAKVERTVETMRERGLLRSEGEDLHPLQHLLNELYLSAGVVRVLGEMVGDLEDPSQWGGEGSGREAHILFQMWSEERDRHAYFSKLALQAGVAERQIRIAEQQAQMVAGAIRGILTELGVAEDPRAPQIVRKHLMQLSPPSETLTGKDGLVTTPEDREALRNA